MKTKFDLFLESEKEVFEITQTEWIEIHKSHMLKCWEITQMQENIIFNDLKKRIEDDKAESILYHKEQVENALKNNIEVSQEVLKDYPTLKNEVEQRKEQKRLREEYLNLLPKLTQEIFKKLNIGDKIKIDNHKVTVHKKEGTELICKLYRSKTKGIVLNIGDRSTITIGW